MEQKSGIENYKLLNYGREEKCNKCDKSRWDPEGTWEVGIKGKGKVRWTKKI